MYIYDYILLLLCRLSVYPPKSNRKYKKIK